MRRIVEQLAGLVLQLRRRLEQEREARRALLAEIETRHDYLPRRSSRTADGLDRMRPEPIDAEPLREASARIGGPALSLIRSRIRERQGPLDECEARDWVRSWLTSLFLALEQSPEDDLVIRAAIGARWDLMRAVCSCQICQDVRIWRDLVALFVGGHAIVEDALWIAWETAHADSSDRILLSAWS